MKKRIFFKVFGGYVILLLLLAVVFLLFSFGTIKKHYLDTLALELQNIGRTLDVRIFDYLDRNLLPELEGFLKEHGKKIGARLTVIDSDGVVKADSELDPAAMEGHRFRPEISDALAGRIGRSLRFSSTLKTQMLYVAIPLDRNGRVEGALRLSFFVRDIEVLLRTIRKDIGWAVAILIGLAVLAAFLFSRSLTRPMRQLIKSSRQVAAGDFSARVRVRSSDEWKELAASFNAMTAEVKGLFDDLKMRKEELDNIMASMQEGLLVLDKTGRITLSNRSARDLIGLEALEGKYFWEVVRMTPFVELIGRVKERKVSETEDVRFGEKSVLCRAAFLPAQDGVVVTLQDTSEIRNLARMKKDFVLNVAHELRTPLTAIKGYAETLEDSTDEKTRGYVQTIIRNTDHLIRIVEDLISLATLEERGGSLSFETVGLNEIAENVLKLFEPKAAAKNLELILESVPDLPRVEGDPFRLEQLLINLVDNAVKYTERGRVRVGLSPEPDGVLIEVADTGIGIPEEEQGRVFERFYVVDKSRSRKGGGTGLGLAIVKHIVLLQGGRIDLRSTPGVGSTFRIFLPSSPSPK